MVEFTADLQGIEPSFPSLDIDPMEIINQYADQFNPSDLACSSLDFQTYNPISNDSYFSNQQVPEFQETLEAIFPSFVDHDNNSNQNDEAPAAQPLVVAGNEFKESKKRIAKDEPKSSSGMKKKKCNHLLYLFLLQPRSGRGKRVINNEKEDEQPKEVVHVRARRGQATDSHSLAERVRRGKINERMKCLQSIIPGCSETMSMTVLLDEIINYVHSLQHNVEFLTTELRAASSLYDFNSKTYGSETMLQTEEVYGATELERLKREVCEGFGSFY